MAAIKTNAIRLLDKNKISYTCQTYTVEDGKIDGMAVAEKLGLDVNRVFKTLLVIGTSKTCYVCVIPVNQELDFKKVSKVTGEKKVEMLPVGDLLKTTGYIRGGCSPLGMKKLFQTYFHESAKDYESITVSAGKIGIQMTVNPEVLITLTKGFYQDLTTDTRV